jgi:hypothetical protein
MVQMIFALTFAFGPLSEKALPPSPTKILSPSKVVTSPTKQASPGNPSARLLITDETEVLLDGLRCSYEQVPDRAVITFAEVGSDRETVRRIHFRSQK